MRLNSSRALILFLCPLAALTLAACGKEMDSTEKSLPYDRGSPIVPPSLTEGIRKAKLQFSSLDTDYPSVKFEIEINRSYSVHSSNRNEHRYYSGTRNYIFQTPLFDGRATLRDATGSLMAEVECLAPQCQRARVAMTDATIGETAMLNYTRVDHAIISRFSQDPAEQAAYDSLRGASLELMEIKGGKSFFVISKPVLLKRANGRSTATRFEITGELGMGKTLVFQAPSFNEERKSDTVFDAQAGVLKLKTELPLD